MGLVEEFKKIVEVSNALMGEKGCLWDRKQTFDTLKTYLLEESYEVLDAVDKQDHHNLLEELGDLFYIIVFFAKVAEKEDKFTLEEVIARVREKLIYRHPHVFGETQLDTIEAIKEQWDALKEDEKAHRKSKLDGIPKTMPALAKAQKFAEVMAQEVVQTVPSDEEELGRMLYEIAYAAKKQKLNAELALSKELLRREESFRKEEGQ